MELEALVAVSPSGARTGLGATIRRATKALTKAGIDFAVIGGIALGKRARPRYTADVDYLVEASQAQASIEALRRAGFVVIEGHEYLVTLRDRRTGAEVDLLFAVGDPEESARLAAKPMHLFGTTAPVAPAEYLLWLYLTSDRAQHFADAVNVVRTGRPNIKWLAQVLRRYDPDSIVRLRTVVARARAEGRAERRRRGKRRKY